MPSLILVHAVAALFLLLVGAAISIRGLIEVCRACCKHSRGQALKHWAIAKGAWGLLVLVFWALSYAVLVG